MTDEEIASLIDISTSYEILTSCVKSYAAMFWYIANIASDGEIHLLEKLEIFTRITSNVLSEMQYKPDDLTYYEFALSFAIPKYPDVFIVDVKEICQNVAKYIAVIKQEIKLSGDTQYVKYH